MKKISRLRLFFGVCAVILVAAAIVAFLISVSSGSGFTGSKSCRSCHAVFYQKWSTSHHGLAMQPYAAAWARTNLMAQTTAVKIGHKAYQYLIDHGVVRETGPAGVRDYPVAYVLGGKNVYYFLTPLARGKLQVLPTGYDVRKRSWYDVPGSAVQHFGGRMDLALDWTDRLYTFNTACFGCHVSQIATKYDLPTDTYRTTGPIRVG